MLRAIICVCILCGVFWVAPPAHALDEVAYNQRTEYGTIDWLSGAAVARGLGKPPHKLDSHTSIATARVLADARCSARQALMLLIASISISADIAVAAMVADRPDLMSQVEKMIQAAREIEEKRKYLSDGSVESYLQFDLFGGFAQLILPDEIHQIQTVIPVKPVPEAADSQSAEGAVAGEFYTGLIVDARKLALSPALAPRVLDLRGQEVYGAAFVSREYAVQKGVVAYVTRPTGAVVRSRVGILPLVVKALRIVGDNQCDIVIGNADADKLRRSSLNLEFLRQCNVAIIVNPSDG